MLDAWVKAGPPCAERDQAGHRVPAASPTRIARGWAFSPVRPNRAAAGRRCRWNAIRSIASSSPGLRRRDFDPAPPAERSPDPPLTFDLIGLPPTPEEVDAFVNAIRAASRSRSSSIGLLASPALRRTLGPALARPRSLRRVGRLSPRHYRPNAWRYRDYVIHAFNDDKPYDRFVREQLAGDEL